MDSLHIDDTRSDREIFFSLENFNLAWRRVRNSTRREVKDYLGLEVYSANTDKHLEILIDNIKRKIYTPQVSDRIYIPKPDKTLRPFVFLNMEDRLCYQAIGNLITLRAYSNLTKRMNKNVFANLPEPPRNGIFTDYMIMRPFSDADAEIKGQYQKFEDALLQTIKEYSQYTDAWIIETDIAHFYPSIDHTLLLDLIQKNNWLTDADLLKCFETCLATWAQYESNKPVKQGIPIGYETSDILATLFLLGIDDYLSSKNLKFLRYVDDIYIFVVGEKKANETLISLDLILQKYSLVRKTTKTDIYPCTDKTREESQIKKRARQKLSMLEIELAQTEDEVQKQSILRKYMQDILDQVVGFACDNSKSLEIIDEHDRELAFIFYRLKEQDEAFKNLALCMLSNTLKYFVQVSTYLSLFKDDEKVISTLLEFTHGALYADMRLHCLAALIKLIGGLNDDIYNILIAWVFESPNWYLRYKAIDILGKYENITNISDQLIPIEQNLNIYQQLINKVFLQYSSDAQINLLNHIFCDTRRTLRPFARYLWHRNIKIAADSLICLEQPDLMWRIQGYDPEKFVRLVAEVFGFNVSHQIIFNNYFNLQRGIQLLMDASESNSTNPHIVAVHDFVVLILNSIAPRYNSTFFDKVKVDEFTSEDLPPFFLENIRIILQCYSWVNKIFLKYDDRIPFIKEATLVLAVAFKEIHEHSDVAMPDDTINKILGVKNMSSEGKVFISYSHQDTKYFNQLKSHLAPYEKRLLLDIWDDRRLIPGQIWKAEIEKALSEMTVAVLLVTDNFLASDFIANVELREVFEKAKQNQCVILWIPVSASSVELTSSEIFSRQSTGSTPDKPLDKMQSPKRKEHWVRACKEIAAAAGISVP